MAKSSKTKSGNAGKTSQREGTHKSSSTIDFATELARLQSLNRLEYEVQRISTAEKLGIRVSVLDDLVGGATRAASDQGKAVVVTDVEPWPESVDGNALLDAISDALRDHLVITNEQADTTALWSVYTHCFDLFRIAPRLGCQAPGMNCGKTEAMRRLKRLVARPASCENLTPAVMFRLVESVKPTLLLDEVDNLLAEDKGALLGLVNSGYERDGRVMRCVGDQNELRAFSTFCPMAYAMIGAPPGTFDSRTIKIEMRRATPAEAAKLKSLEDGESEDLRFKNLGRMAARWAADNAKNLIAARPDMAGLVNRIADNWRPLFAIADIAGSEWPVRARKAAKALCAKMETESPFVETLSAIKKIIGDRTEVSSKEIVHALVSIEGGPWAEWGKANKPITQNALARLLKPHKVFPDDIGPERSRRKGYRRAQFAGLFEAYLKESPPPGPEIRAAAQNSSESERDTSSEARSRAQNCADGKSEASNGEDRLRGCAAASPETTDRNHRRSADDMSEAA
jgi:putative DNA primase/helicase